MIGRVGWVVISCLIVLTAGQSSGAPNSPAISCHPRCIEHVVIIVLENSKLANVLSQGAYLDYLWNADGHATNYYAVCHPSTANYLALTNGRSLACGSDSYVVHSERNIADELGKKGLTWMAYEESMPVTCDTSNSGEYVVRHDPFVSYRDIVGRSTRCDSHVVNSSGFNTSVANGKLGNYSFYSPNLFDDGHTPQSVSHASSWLQGFLAPILNHTGRFASSAERNLVNHTAFLIVYDESGNSDTSGYTAGGTTIAGGHVYLTVVSPYSAGLTYDLNASHYNLDSTVEWLFHTPSDGGYDGTAAYPSMSTLFDFTSNGY
ncbi:MAG: alkaline phosphatase family protein [Thermoplasmata archaeon]|nr:alkaline phosphatase family protein [Thermoplasmata archaeon]